MKYAIKHNLLFAMKLLLSDIFGDILMKKLLIKGLHAAFNIILVTPQEIFPYPWVTSFRLLPLIALQYFIRIISR